MILRFFAGPLGPAVQRKKTLFSLTGPHCAQRTNRMKPESQAASEGPFILSEGSVRAGTRGERRGRKEEGEKVCKDPCV